MKKDIMYMIFVPLFLLLIVYPIVALLGRLSMEGITRTFADPYFIDAIKNTIIAACLAAILSLTLAVGFGYCHLFKKDTLVYRLANLMNDLPISLPHTVAGLALLLAFGRKAFGFLGPTGLAFSMIALVLAMFFVSYPLAARAMASGVENIEREIIDVARTLGDTPTKAYFRVVIPLLGESMFSGFVLSFSRSISEFAAVIMFGGNLPGSTQVLASYVFSKVEEGELQMAITASGFCILLSLVLVYVMWLTSRRLFKNVKS